MKKFYLSIIPTIIALLLAGYFVFYHPQSHFINTIERGLSEQELQGINDKMQNLNTQLSEAKDKGDKDNLFKLELSLATEYDLAGDLLNAKSFSEDATKLKSDDSRGWYELFIIDRERTDNKSAERDIKKATDFDPSNSQYWRSYLEFGQGSLQYPLSQMEDLFKQALQKTNSHVDIVTYYARYLANQDDIEGAIDQWKQAEALNPDGKSLYEQEIMNLRNQ